MIDTHMHADSRSSEDFEKMFIGGIDTAITCSYYPYKINDNPEILFIRFLGDTSQFITCINQLLELLNILLTLVLSTLVGST
jgi:hypothetical protein